METPTQHIENDGEDINNNIINNKITCINNDRALHHSLLACSVLIDEEDAIIPPHSLSPKRFTGWEAVCEIFVTRDESLLLSTSFTRYVPGRKREIKERERDTDSTSSDSDDFPEPTQTQTQIQNQLQNTNQNQNQKIQSNAGINNNQKKEKPKLKRPPSSRTPILPPTSPSSPSATIISPKNFLPDIGSGSKIEEEKKDFLPKIERRHSASKKEYDAKVTKNTKTITLDPPPNLQMYSSEPLKPVLFEPQYSNNNSNNRRPESPKKVMDLPEPPARLRMYYPRSAMYNSSSSSSSSANSSNKKTVNIS